jgi:hypothetical protein
LTYAFFDGAWTHLVTARRILEQFWKYLESSKTVSLVHYALAAILVQRLLASRRQQVEKIWRLCQANGPRARKSYELCRARLPAA